MNRWRWAASLVVAMSLERRWENGLERGMSSPMSAQFSPRSDEFPKTYIYG